MCPEMWYASFHQKQDTHLTLLRVWNDLLTVSTMLPDDGGIDWIHHLRSYGMTPTRVDRCCYVFHSKTPTKSGRLTGTQVQFDILEQIEKAIESLADPITGSPSHGKLVSGIICLHVDDLFFFCVGDKEFYHHVVSAIQKDYKNWFRRHQRCSFCRSMSTVEDRKQQGFYTSWYQTAWRNSLW